ncbi:MAG: L,D-transpeptidase [Bacteriovorax sp.]
MKNILTRVLLTCSFFSTITHAYEGEFSLNRPVKADASFEESSFTHAYEGESFSRNKPVDVNVSFDESYFELFPWIKEFHYVVVVNKAESGKEAQSIKVYEFGKMIIESKVSTGRDEYERAGEHHSKRDAWSVTPTGYYTPTYLDKDHRSTAYGGKWSRIFGGAKMPYAIFFNDGIALHQAPKGTESQLGTNASGGCVRLSSAVAPELFERVSETSGARNPKFTVDGKVKLDAKGNYEYSEVRGYSALIIVQNKVIN